MDKKTFLEELRKSLRVLKEEELQDIIGEYEQHIDLKVKNGLTEEQAIADFGNIKELAAEILEAYHVRAEFSFSEEGNSVNGSESESGPAANSNTTESASTTGYSEPESDRTVKSGFLENGMKMLCLGGQWFGSKFRWIVHMVWSVIRWCGGQLLRPVHWGKGLINEKKELRKRRQTQDMTIKAKVQEENTCDVEPKEPGDAGITKIAVIQTKGLFRRTVRGVTNMLHGTWSWMVDVTILCIRICWNCFAVGTAFFAGCLGLMCLYTVGVLGVLLFQGYPLVGLTIGCIGVVLCLFAGAALAWTMIWRKTKNKNAVDETADTQSVDTREMEVGQNA